MRQQRIPFMKQINSLSMKWFLIILICFTRRFNICSSYNLRSSLQKIGFLDGCLSFDQNEFAAQDFGDQIHLLPLAVLHPRSARDVAKMVEFVWQMGPDSPVTVAARGNAHSTHGQAQADQHGIVINVEDLSGGQEGGMEVHLGEFPYVDVSGGELWINVLQKCLNYGLAPKSWTDYLYLTIGGTLSNAGISGQAFRHGPQISNVLQLEVVTGKGVVVNCSEQQNPDLFHAVLGGLGQFGIITRARISLDPAPKMVKWIKAMYSNFSTFSGDQEHLKSSDQTFDYIEGFVIKNKTGGFPNSRKLSLNPDGRRQFKSDSEDSTFFSIELTKNFNPDQNDTTNQEVKSLLSQLNYIPSTLEISEVSYETFLNRVHESEIALRSKGLWEVPHPWLNLIIPKSKIQTFAQEVFGNIVQDTSNGIIIVYPVNKSKWSNRTSFVFPEADEEVFYLASLLFFANPNSKIPSDGLEYLVAQNKRILDFCEKSRLGVKQYLPYHTTTEEWKEHLGPRWQMFVQRKKVYDPLAMLAPGQRIFQKSVPFF